MEDMETGEEKKEVGVSQGYMITAKLSKTE